MRKIFELHGWMYTERYVSSATVTVTPARTWMETQDNITKLHMEVEFPKDTLIYRVRAFAVSIDGDVMFIPVKKNIIGMIKARETISTIVQVG